MNIDLILQNILNPPILFFLRGMLAVFFKSEPLIPRTINFGIQISCPYFPLADHPFVFSLSIFDVYQWLPLYKFGN